MTVIIQDKERKGKFQTRKPDGKILQWTLKNHRKLHRLERD